MQGKKDPEVRAAIADRIKMGDKPSVIAKDLGVDPSTVYHVRRYDLGITGKVDFSNPADPAAAGAMGRVAMTAEDMARFTGRDEAMVIAGLYTTEAVEASLKKRHRGAEGILQEASVGHAMAASSGSLPSRRAK